MCPICALFNGGHAVVNLYNMHNFRGIQKIFIRAKIQSGRLIDKPEVKKNLALLEILLLIL